MKYENRNLKIEMKIEMKISLLQTRDRRTICNLRWESGPGRGSYGPGLEM
jgi:hypothetical protein